MKKSQIALAIAALVPALAQAQSNVTMYGVIEPTVDVGYKATTTSVRTVTTGAVTTVTGSGSEYKPGFRVQDGNSQGVGTSRWGVRGNEDLGGGMKANFQLEMGLRIDEGCANNPPVACTSGNSGGNNQLFGRNAWGGLSGGFGEIRLGRQLTGAFVVQANSLQDGAASGLYTTGTVTPLMGGVRFSNALKYITPNLGGLTATLTLAAPEGPPTTATVGSTGAIGGTVLKNKTGVDLAVEYSNGPVYLGVGFDKRGSTGGTVTGTTAITGTTSDIKGFTIGGNFNAGVVQPFFHYARQKTTSATEGTVGLLNGASANLEKAFNVGIKVPFGNVTMNASYGKGTIAGSGLNVVGTVSSALANNATLKAFQVGAQYKLSNRTLFEANIGQFKGDLADANVTGATTTTNATANRERGLNFGVRHAF